MKRMQFSALALASALLMLPGELSARGFGGGGGRSMGGGGRSFGGGGISRPSVPNLGANRQLPSRQMPSRPNIQPYNLNRPSFSRPSAPNLPQVTRPSGGLKPSTHPSVTRPSVTRPSMPTTRPSNKLPNTRPESRPSIPSLGGNNGDRPNLNLPNRPSGDRPSAGDLGDFLGMDKPGRPSKLPAGTRPGIDESIANRPSIGDRPNVANRPNIGNGSGNTFVNNRPVDIGQIKIGNNTAINNRPSWANLDRGNIASMNTRWQNQIGGMQNWQTAHPNRAAYWAGWGAGVHSAYHWHNRNPGCFRGDWWYSHPYRWGGWHYGYGFYRRPWSYWWTVPTYAATVSWFNWPAPQTVWAQPVYYDYGQGGNVVYNDNSVYINGDQVATSTEFAQSAAELATVTVPANEEEAKQAEWMSLGTFTLSASEKDVDPNHILQLAVSKEGIISGTMYNTQTDQTQAIQGQVDKNTQRVAFRFGDNDTTVAESGIYNLTQDEAPLLVHIGPEKVENWLLVRLDDPSPENDPSLAR